MTIATGESLHEKKTFISAGIMYGDSKYPSKE